MDLYFSATSPYARIVRVTLQEKGLHSNVTSHVVDPWADDPDLMQVNPVVRVPTLVTDNGEAITESMLMVIYLEQFSPIPSLVPSDRNATVLGQAGLAFGILDAAVAILIGRKTAGAEFDAGPVGKRRHRAIEGALERLEQSPPVQPDKAMDLGAIAVAVALDYLDFRFPTLNWASARPRLAAWRGSLGNRPSLADTAPPAA